MSEPQNLSSYDDHGTTVINVTNRHLSQFVQTIEYIESGGYDLHHGIYKLKVDKVSRTEGTNSKELLKILRPHLKSNCVLQELRKYPLCSGVFGYKKHTPPTGLYVDDFEKKMKNLASYYAPDNSCQQVLRTGNFKAAVEQWLKEVESCSIEVKSGRSQCSNLLCDEEEKQRLIEKGTELKAEYTRLLSLPCGTVDIRKGKDVFTNCECPDCFTESDTDSESDEGSSAKRKKRYKVKPKYSEVYTESVLSRFPRYAAGIQLLPKQGSVKVTKDFSLCSIISVLDLLPNVYTGLQIPYWYIGDSGSFFAAHVEDCSLYSANYLFLGAPKVWITIRAEFCEKVRKVLQTVRMELAHTSCMNSLSHKYYFFTLKMLEDNNVPYHITAQYEGEMVIIQPNVIHLGFNSGPNVSQAANFGTVAWIPEGVRSMRWRCRCYGDDSIHIDLKNLVGAFHPEMLTTLYDNGDTDGAQHFSVLEELHDAKYAAKEPAKEKRKQRTLKTYECPDPECTVAMLDHKERVVQHINSKHVNRGQEFVDKLLQDFEKKYPSRKKEISNGFVCKVCGSLISGSVTHLEKHYLRQVRNAKLEDSKRELYAQACKELQENIKRRERGVKSAID